MVIFQPQHQELNLHPLLQPLKATMKVEVERQFVQIQMVFMDTHLIARSIISVPMEHHMSTHVPLDYFGMMLSKHVIGQQMYLVNTKKFDFTLTQIFLLISLTSLSCFSYMFLACLSCLTCFSHLSCFSHVFHMFFTCFSHVSWMSLKSLMSHMFLLSFIFLSCFSHASHMSHVFLMFSTHVFHSHLLLMYTTHITVFHVSPPTSEYFAWYFRQQKYEEYFGKF